MIATEARRLVTLAASAAVVFIAGGALPAGAQSLDQLHAAAKTEGALAFYVGGPTAPWEAKAKNLRAALSRHQDFDHRRLLQRARQEGRCSSSPPASSRSTSRCSRP